MLEICHEQLAMKQKLLRTAQHIAHTGNSLQPVDFIFAADVICESLLRYLNAIQYSLLVINELRFRSSYLQMQLMDVQIYMHLVVFS